MVVKGEVTRGSVTRLVDEIRALRGGLNMARIPGELGVKSRFRLTSVG